MSNNEKCKCGEPTEWGVFVCPKCGHNRLEDLLDEEVEDAR